ncbi:MAG: KamA family radical SAM protein [Myxococcota bacterium]
MYHDDAGRTAPARPAGRVLGRREALERFDGLDPALWQHADAAFPVRVTRSWADRIIAIDDPLALQALPQPEELTPDAADLLDPTGEDRRSPHPWIIQKHPDRVLLIVTRRCHLNCRYCFRRNHTGPNDPSPDELASALDFVRSSGARELILSGGDPLALRDARLFSVMDAVRPAVPVVRIHTRAPITAPRRVTDALVAGLRARPPIWVIVHCNHPQELSASVRDGLSRLVDAGIPVLNQAVLLRRVNDDPVVLAELCEALVSLRVFPYYLHHTDKAAGNVGFRVSVERGLEIYDALEGMVSGVALPRYVIDPPDGSGKITVREWARRARAAAKQGV